jgi:hypothetical protein
MQNGKGDKTRPLTIPQAEFRRNWTLIFDNQKSEIGNENEKENNNHEQLLNEPRALP